MNFHVPQLPICEQNVRIPFHFSPIASTISLVQRFAISNACPSGYNFYVGDFANDLKVHAFVMICVTLRA